MFDRQKPIREGGKYHRSLLEKGVNTTEAYYMYSFQVDLKVLVGHIPSCRAPSVLGIELRSLMVVL